MPAKPLEGIRVVDCSQIWAGPFATKAMGDMGAQVIKVESARRVDNTRRYGSLPGGERGDRPYNRRGAFNSRNRSKMGITLDLTTDQGKNVFKRLVAIGDVVVENFSARVMPGLGLGYHNLREVKDDIIMLSLPAFGATGPHKGYLGQGSNLSPMSGLVGISGYEDRGPQYIGAYTDPVGGLSGLGAVLAALHHRRRTGKGQYIDLAQQEAAVRFFGETVMDYSMNGRVHSQKGNKHVFRAPHNCYPCRGDDKWVAIAVGNDDQWKALCRVADHDEWATDPRFADSLSRWKNQEELDPLIADWTKDLDHVDVAKQLQEAGVPAGQVASVAELGNDPQLKARGFLEDVTHPEAGTFPMLGRFWELSKTPGGVSSPAPMLGQHNDYVFRELLGLSSDELASMETEGVTSNVPRE